MPNIESEQRLEINSSIYTKKGDSELENSPFNLTWFISIPDEEKYNQIITNIISAAKKLDKHAGKLIDRTHIYPRNTIIQFDIYFKEGKNLSEFAKKVFEGIDMKNLFNENGTNFSLRAFNTLIEKAEKVIFQNQR